MNKSIYLLIGIVVLGGLGFFIFRSPALAPTMEEDDNGVACTADAKQCPDGSYVGRIGPRCEFSTCPVVSKSGISGRVTLGPTCPVERIPPDPKCAPAPYETSIYITKPSSSTFSRSIKSDANGAFSVELDQGTYVIKAQGGKIYPRCGEVTVEVKSGQYTTANISCDTGIR